MSKQTELVGLARTTNLDEVNAAYSAGALSNRNLIINGAMQVWQRGTSFTGISNGQYTADRWAVQRTGTVNVTRTSTGLNGFPYALRITATSSTSIKPIHWIEMNNALYVGQTVTLSFWARASANGFNYDITGYNGTSSEAWASTDDLGGLTTEWKKFTVTQTLTVDGISNHYRLHWVDTGYSGDWLEITGVQLEAGDTATPFEHRSYGQELALCQRYYQTIGKVSGATNTVVPTYLFYTASLPVPLRATPTYSQTGVITADVPGITNYTQSSPTGGVGFSSDLCSFSGSLTNFPNMSTRANMYMNTGGNSIVLDAEL